MQQIIRVQAPQVGQVGIKTKSIVFGRFLLLCLFITGCARLQVIPDNTIVIWDYDGNKTYIYDTIYDDFAHIAHYDMEGKRLIQRYMNNKISDSYGEGW